MAAVVAAVALAAPGTVLAAGDAPSAYQVYIEQGPNAGGALTATRKGLSPLVVKRCAQLAQSRKSGTLLCALLASPALGAIGGLRENGSGSSPGTFGAVWNLGFGPTALLALLLASFAAPLGRDGWRFWRRRGVAVP